MKFNSSLLPPIAIDLEPAARFGACPLDVRGLFANLGYRPRGQASILLHHGDGSERSSSAIPP